MKSIQEKQFELVVIIRHLMVLIQSLCNMMNIQIHSTLAIPLPFHRQHDL